MLNFKAIAMTGGAAFIAGTLGGGIAMHKLVWGKVQAEKAKAIQTTLEFTKTALKEQQDFADKETTRADRLDEDLQRTRTALNDAMQANAVLAASRASTTTRIIQDGEKIGEKLEGDYAWLRYAWPSELLDYANGSTRDVQVSEPEGIGYR